MASANAEPRHTMQSISVLLTRVYRSGEFTWLLIALGIALRIKQYLHNKSLWLDEAALALNLVSRSFSDLFQPLQYNQAAPIGFLMLEKSALKLGGNNEYVLRLFPLVFGIASLFLFYWVAGRFLRATAVPLSVGLFAVSEYLVFYSAELKQYSSDVAITLLLFLLADNVIQQKPRRRSMIIIGCVGAMSIWFSHPSVFVLAGIGTVLAFTFLLSKQPRQLVSAMIVGLCWLTSVGVNYIVSLRSIQANSWLQDWWTEYFAPLPPRTFADFKWFYDRFFEVFETPLDFRISGVAALAFIVGCYIMSKEKRWRSSLLISPAAVTLLASGVHVYPFYGRLLLFLTPILLLFISEGATEIVEKTRLSSPAIGVVFIALLIIYPLRSGAYAMVRPFYRAEMKPIMKCISGEYHREDLIYVHFGASSAFKYYLDRYGLSNSDYSIGTDQIGKPEKYIAEIDSLRGNERVWFVFSLHGPSNAREQAIFLDYLDKVGKRLKVCTSPGAASYLYDLRTGP